MNLGIEHLGLGLKIWIGDYYGNLESRLGFVLQIGIGGLDRELKFGIRIGDLLGLGIEDWGLVLGIWIRDWDWGLELGFGIGDWGLGLDIGDGELDCGF